MGFKNFYLSESKTYKDSNQFVTLYHASPEGDIKRFRPKMKKILGDEVVFFSPSFNSLVLDWIPYVRGKKQGNGDELYKTIYLYTIKLPKATYKKAKEYYNEKIKESGNGDNYGFWGWGAQIFLTKDMVDDIQIVNVKKLSEGEVKKLYKKERNDERNRTNRKDVNIETLRKLPKDWLNLFHIKLLETILDYSKNKKDITELEKLNSRMYRLRVGTNNNNWTHFIKDTKDVNKEEFEKIKKEFENITNPKPPSRDKTKEFQEWSGKIIEKLKNSSSQAVQKIIIPRLTEFRDLNKKDEFKKTLNRYKEWLGEDL